MNEERKNRGRKGIVLAVVMFFVILSLTFSVSAQFGSYSRSYIQNAQSGLVNDASFAPSFNRQMCREGQDFVLQVSPLGCTPSVVRSDLLENQNVPVFCPIVGTQINPLVDVEAIDRITFSGELPREVSGVGFHPAQAALGRIGGQISLDSPPVLDNLGYAVVVLRQQRNESAMPDFVEGNLTARITYDVENAFGVGRASFYLPVLDDREWDRDFVQYGFWQGRGYLRAESVGEDRASISIYSDRETNSRARTNNRRVATESILAGEMSRPIPMPGFDYCVGTMEIKLDSVESPDTTAKLNVNGDVFEVREGERFLDNNCRVRNIEKQGINEEAEVLCNAERGEGRLNLVVSPKLDFVVGDSIQEVSVGDKLYDNGVKSVFLAYVTTKDGSLGEENLTAGLVAVPGVNKEKLTDSELKSFSDFFERSESGDMDAFLDDPSILGGLKSFFLGVTSAVEKGGRYVVQGEDLEGISFGESETFLGKTVRLDGFSDAVDADLSQLDSQTRNYYESAVEDYEDVLDSFASEKYPPEFEIGPTLGEQALRGVIDVQRAAGQMRTVTDLCEEFEDTYPNSIEGPPAICSDESKLSSSVSPSGNVFIKGRTYSISLDRVKEPTFKEFGAEVLISTPDGNQSLRELRKEEIVILNQTSGAFIQLVDIRKDSSGENSIRIRTNLREGALEEAGRVFVGSETRTTIREGFPESRQGYLISLRQVNLEEVARVSIIPSIYYQETEAEFPFRIGIEKRSDLFKLSPEKTRERIDSLNETLDRWRSINDGLEQVVDIGNKACLGVGATLTVKNFFSNLAGEGIARQKVMRGDGGWFEICGNAVNKGSKIGNKGPWTSVNSCLLDLNEEVESSVDEVTSIIKNHNEEIEKIQEGVTTSRFLGENVVNTDAFLEKLVDEDYKSELERNLAGVTVEVDGQQVAASEIIQDINTENTYVTQARDLQLNARLLNSDDPVVRDVAKGQINSYLTDIYVNTRESVLETTLRDILPSGISELDVSVQTRGDAITDVYKGKRTSQSVGQIPSGVPAQNLVYGGEEYVLQLQDAGNGNYQVVEVYDTSGSVVGGEASEEIKSRFLYEFRDEASYQNPCPNCELRYYETGEYAGLPAVVPFDKQNGWYAAIKSNLPIGGNVRAYDDSGRVSSFYMCNVGQNGRVEFFAGVGDDDCVLINPGLNQPYDRFPGLDKSETSRLTSRAVQAIAEASRQHRAGLSEIRLFGQRIKVGEPSVGIPDIQCQDFMSAADCNLMFNVCDPFVCPSSRCDLGGKYPVADVVQSGIVGSLALCAPNFPEVKVPICVSGVYAASQGYENVLSDYQSCLQHSLDTGQQVGICDELHSVYICDFIWRQGLPLANAVIPQALGEVLNQKSTRGGGEYLDARSAWQNAADSANFFVQEYAVNSARAFQARSVEGVGTEVCRNWVSVAAPDGGSLFDSLTKPRVPVQFHGWFDEIPFSTATVPPISQYNVFYNIYAGEDVPTYYQVYLRGTGEAFFQDTPSRRIVASGFIPTGESATCGDNPNQPCKFTAPTGFSELCIVVNNQEECGFGKVSTEFGVNYITEEFVADQASRTDIRSESECVSGTPSLAGLLNPNLQAGVEGAINPELQNQGITRICATGDPGSATDSAAGTEDARWVRVGNCGEQQIGCWLDTESVRDTVRRTGIEDKVVGDVTEDYLEALKNETGYLTMNEFNSLTEDIADTDNPREKINLINENIERVFLSYEKGFLTLVRGNAYSDLMRSLLQGGVDDDDNRNGIDDGNKDIDRERRGSESEELTGFNLQYPVFEFSDGRFLSGQNIHYTFAEGNWYWSFGGNDPKEGGEWFDASDVEVLRTESVAPGSAPSETLRLNAENLEWTSRLVDASYLEGLKVLIDRAALNEESSIFSDAELSTENVIMKNEDGERLFTVLGSGFSFGPLINFGETDLYYRFDAGQKEWQWSPDQINWMGTDTTSVSGGRFEGETPTELNIKLINELESETDFVRGAATIFSIDTGAGLGVVKEELGNGRTPTEDSQEDSSGCSNQEECQRFLGQRIIDIASEIRDERGNLEFMSDSSISGNLGLDSFECLALAVSYTESRIKHCRQYEQNGDPLYCDGDRDEIISGDEGSSLGIMQINEDVHGEKLSFEENVRYGLNLLVNRYDENACLEDPESCVYNCYRPDGFGSTVRESDFQSVSYTLWERSIRYYNGWNTQCTRDSNNDGVLEEVGNPRYVEDVVNSEAALQRLFPEVC